jgi:hypothetical protein
MRILVCALLSSICINSEQVFVACEGNYYDGNQGTLWTISEGAISEYPDNPIGNIAQSLYVHDDLLFLAVNGSGNIQVFQITDSSLIPLHIIDTQSSGPREMLVYNDKLYFTNWYSADVKKLSLSTWEIESEIAMPGLPEDIIFHDGYIYVSITMNLDWSDASSVVAIDPDDEAIINTYDVGYGPGSLLVHNGAVYVSRTYYDSSWNAFYGTSRIRSNGVIDILNYGSGAICGGGIYKYQNSVYRTYDGGIAKINENLEIMPDTKLGDYNPLEVYSAKVIGDNIYFGLSDFLGFDEVAVIDSDGNETARYTVGAIPGDFAVWSSCSNNGDVNLDGYLNVVDIILIVSSILDEEPYNCISDMNNDSIVNISDIIIIIQIITNQ